MHEVAPLVREGFALLNAASSRASLDLSTTMNALFPPPLGKLFLYLVSRDFAHYQCLSAAYMKANCTNSKRSSSNRNIVLWGKNQDTMHGSGTIHSNPPWLPFTRLLTVAKR